MGSLKIQEGAAQGGKERETEGGRAADARGRGGGGGRGKGAELCRRGMQIVSMCGEDRRAVLAAVRCG